MTIAGDRNSVKEKKARGQRLRTLREALGVTRGDLSNKLRVAQIALDQLENGIGRAATQTPLINAILDHLQADPAMDNYVWNGGELPASLEARVTAQYRFEIHDHEHHFNVMYPFVTAESDTKVGARFKTYRMLTDQSHGEVAEKCYMAMEILIAFESEELIKMQRDQILLTLIRELGIPPEVVKYLKDGGSIPRYFHMDATYRGTDSFYDFEHNVSVDAAPSQFHFATQAELAIATKRLRTTLDALGIKPDQLPTRCGILEGVFNKLLREKLSFEVGKGVFDAIVTRIEITPAIVDYLFKGGLVPNALLNAARDNGHAHVIDHASGVAVAVGVNKQAVAAGKRLAEVISFRDVTYGDIYEQTQVTPIALEASEKGRASLDEITIVIEEIVARMNWPKNTSQYVIDGDSYISYTHFLEEPVQEKPVARRPEPEELVQSRGSKESQLDRIERLVNELILSPGATAQPSVFTPSVPKGATHYVDSLNSHDGAMRFYKTTEDGWLYVWGMVHEVNELGWTVPTNRAQLRLTKLP